MNKNRFINSQMHRGIPQEELERMWRVQKEYLEMQALLEAAAIQHIQSASAIAAGGGGSVPEGDFLILEDSQPGSPNYLLQEDGGFITL